MAVKQTKAAWPQVTGHNVTCIMHQLSEVCGFTPRGSADIKDAFPGLCQAQRGDKHGARVLHLEQACMITGQCI